MKTFTVKKEGIEIAEVTAYTHLQAMRKAARSYNDYRWDGISVSIKINPVQK